MLFLLPTESRKLTEVNKMNNSDLCVRPRLSIEVLRQFLCLCIHSSIAQDARRRVPGGAMYD